jgi:cytochrome c-type biogenesis protein CcmH/NrfG
MITRKQTKTLFGFIIALAVIIAIFFRNLPHRIHDEARLPDSSASKEFSPPSKANVSPTFNDQVELLKKSVKENPTNAAHLIALARLLMDGHQGKEAIAYFEKAAAIQPHNDSLLIDLSICYFNDHNSEKALSTTERILTFNKYNPRALYNKGAILANQGKFKEAAAVWRTLMKNAPNSHEAEQVKTQITQLEK